MSSVLGFFRTNPGYLPAFILGLLVAAPYSVPQLDHGLQVAGPIVAIALVASLLPGFAAFSLSERWNKLWLLYAPLGVFGVLAMDTIKEPTAEMAFLMVAAMGMHISYWNSGLHSRAFRLEQFRMGFAAEFPACTRLIACLNGTGRSELGDQMVQAFLNQADLPPFFWSNVPHNLSRLMAGAITEFEEAAQREQGT